MNNNNKEYYPNYYGREDSNSNSTSNSVTNSNLNSLSNSDSSLISTPHSNLNTNHSRNRQQLQSAYTDLREMLNKKRQHQTDPRHLSPDSYRNSQAEPMQAEPTDRKYRSMTFQNKKYVENRAKLQNMRGRGSSRGPTRGPNRGASRGSSRGIGRNSSHEFQSNEEGDSSIDSLPRMESKVFCQGPRPPKKFKFPNPLDPQGNGSKSGSTKSEIHDLNQELQDFTLEPSHSRHTRNYPRMIPSYVIPSPNARFTYPNSKIQYVCNSPKKQHSLKHLNPVNIKVEFSTETGEHRYSMERGIMYRRPMPRRQGIQRAYVPNGAESQLFQDERKRKIIGPAAEDCDEDWDDCPSEEISSVTDDST